MPPAARTGRSRREHIIGVREKLTIIETRTATVAVRPNSNSILPATLEMNDTGRKTITSDRVMASTARPISLVPMIAACIGDAPRSSIQWKMFSRTTIASSMTTPTISTRASIVTLLSVKSITRIMANVATSDVGMAIAAINVDRHDRMKSSTTPLARMLPTIRCFWISSSAARM